MPPPESSSIDPSAGTSPTADVPVNPWSMTQAQADKELALRSA
jgi:hypothetical protein